MSIRINGFPRRLRSAGARVARVMMGWGAAVEEINARNAAGQTCLMLAAQSSTLQEAQLLLKHGADVSLRDLNDWTALDYAMEHNGPVELLKRAGGVSGVATLSS